MTGKSIVALAGDPGGGAALLPVLEALLAEGAELSILAYGETLANWSARSLPCTALASCEAAEADHWLAGAALLLTATSCNAWNAERTFWQSAHRQDIPSLAVLDFWSNYRERFLVGGEPLWPNRVAVMDDIAARGMAAAGCPRERIAITGHPGFDTFAGTAAKLGPQELSTLRQHLGMAEGQPLVLFVSQPLRTLNKDILGRDPTFDEFSVLAAVIEALERLTAEWGRPPTLVIRPHPREAAGKFEPFASRNIRVAVDTASPPHTLIRAADLIVGMNSMLLLEACLLGQPVLSIQPGSGPAHDPLPSNAFGASQPVYRQEDIFPAFAGLLTSPERLASLAGQTWHFRPRPGATSRVQALVHEMAY